MPNGGRHECRPYGTSRCPPSVVVGAPTHPRVTTASSPHPTVAVPGAPDTHAPRIHAPHAAAAPSSRTSFPFATPIPTTAPSFPPVVSDPRATRARTRRCRDHSSRVVAVPVRTFTGPHAGTAPWSHPVRPGPGARLATCPRGDVSATADGPARCCRSRCAGTRTPPAPQRAHVPRRHHGPTASLLFAVQGQFATRIAPAPSKQSRSFGGRGTRAVRMPGQASARDANRGRHECRTANGGRHECRPYATRGRGTRPSPHRPRDAAPRAGYGRGTGGVRAGGGGDRGRRIAPGRPAGHAADGTARYRSCRTAATGGSHDRRPRARRDGAPWIANTSTPR